MAHFNRAFTMLTESMCDFIFACYMLSMRNAFTKRAFPNFLSVCTSINKYLIRKRAYSIWIMLFPYDIPGIY